MDGKIYALSAGAWPLFGLISIRFYVILLSLHSDGKNPYRFPALSEDSCDFCLVFFFLLSCVFSR